MAFPAQYFYSILDVAGRWGCTQTAVVNWAISGELDLVAGFSPILFGDEPAAGLLVVSASDVRPLFRPFGKAAKKIFVKQARRIGTEELKLITKPARGLRLTAADIMITAREIDRFEDAHGIGRTRNAGPGAPGRYDWEGFHMALFKRIYTGGFPLQQRDLVIEMQEWFIANSDAGEAPDESTIRRRIKAIWQELNPAQT
ncbi:hypothetical protein RNZ50_26495 [Paracoccaceae bacterium Fryx2]|nr:hypothetical protein [Paracoccaceae bacterium Fryx2]